MIALETLRARTARLILAVLLAVASPAAAQSTAATKRPAAVRAVDIVGMTVSDMDRATDFYANVLTFRKVSDTEVAGDKYEHLSGVFGSRARIVRMTLGGETIELTEYLAPEGRPIPVDSKSQDRWFQHIAIIVSDMDAAYRILRQHRVRHASTGPQRLPDWNPNAGGIQAFYFKDPDGHTLEILAFPEGKGAAKWHRLTERIFLGVDHTAIVVGDTDASLGFYRDVLGFTIAGASENYGTEQEHLNNVFGARLRITSLQPPSGPNIELLEYLAPRDGRPYPTDAKSNDVLHWQTTLVTADVDAAARALRARGLDFVSPGPVTMTGMELGFTKGFLVRDPDGHVMEVVQK